MNVPLGVRPSGPCCQERPMTAPIVARFWSAAFSPCPGVGVITPFLERPAVPVEVGEVREARVVAARRVQPRRESAVPRADRRLVADLADADPAFEQPLSRSLEVVDDEQDVASRSGGAVGGAAAGVERAPPSG